MGERDVYVLNAYVLVFIVILYTIEYFYFLPTFVKLLKQGNASVGSYVRVFMCVCVHACER